MGVRSLPATVLLHSGPTLALWSLYYVGEVVTHYSKEDIRLAGKGNGVRSVPTAVPLPSNQVGCSTFWDGWERYHWYAPSPYVSQLEPLDFVLVLNEAQAYRPQQPAHELGLR